MVSGQPSLFSSRSDSGWLAGWIMGNERRIRGFDLEISRVIFCDIIKDAN